MLTVALKDIRTCSVQMFVPSYRISETNTKRQSRVARRIEHLFSVHRIEDLGRMPTVRSGFFVHGCMNAKRQSRVARRIEYLFSVLRIEDLGRMPNVRSYKGP